MRPVQQRSGTRLPCLLALSSLALLGCGGSDAPGASTEGASTAKAPAATKPASTGETAEPDGPPGLKAQPTGNGGMMMVPPGQVVGEQGDEEAVDAPMDPTFPGAVEAAPARPAVEGLPADDPILGAPLVINGRVIPFERIREAVCTDNLGAAHIESAKVGVFIQQEVDRRVAAGYDRKDLVVGDEELSAALAELEEEIKQEYPGGEIGIDDVLASMGTEKPREQMRTMRLFKKLYLPENPDELPPLTIEALLATPGGDTILEEYRRSWEQRQTPEGVRKRNFAERQFDEAIIETIHGYLMSTAKVERAPAEGVLYRVNGRDITVEQIWRMIAPRITTAEVRKAKQWIVNWELLKAAFEEAGAWLSDEEAAAAYAAHSDPYKDSIFSQERIALVVKEFPSVDRYKDYRRLYESLLRMRSPIPPAELEKQAQFRTNKVVGQVSVDVDILLTAAFDQEQFRWKENGWVLAEQKMRDVINLLVEEQRPWEELMENYSDFYDRPVPMSQRDQVDTEAVKGRFRNYQRNNLLAELGESEYLLFLNGGESVTDFIFFEQEVGTLGDPMRGPLGWYMPRLLRRTKAPTKVNINPESMNALILDDYLSWHVAQLARDLIAKNEVYGLEMPGSRPELPAQPGTEKPK